MRGPILALTVCLSPLAAQAQSNEEAAAGAVLDALHAAAAKADAKTYFALYTPDAVFIGTDVSERWTLPEFRAYAAKPFAEGRGWTYVKRERHVRLAPGDCRCVAWFDEVLDSKSYGTARGTGVLVKGEGGWKVAQYALTFPIPNDLADRMTAEIKAFEAKARP
jgi:ketosteroid isomerase-like protein